ncbi:MAG: HAD family hydrolase [Candidatus Bathyarchaeota archaeon]|nr:HAD family hydrolase [Candidatus Bathyarchaeota archaeon]
MKPLILFDMDGTLIIQEKPPEYQGTKTHYGPYMSIKAQMKEIVIKHGVPSELVFPLNRMALIWNATRLYLEEHDYTDAEIKAVMTEINEPFMVEERADHEISVLIPDTIPGLEALQKLGYEMGLVTTASRESYDRISSDHAYGCFGDYFKHSITRDESRYIKPDPEPINRILELYNRDEFVYIGDSDHDAYACNAAGGRFVLLNTRCYDIDTVDMFSPYAVIERLSELPEILGN